MSTRARCHCQSCTIRGLTGPAVVITLGVLFLLSELHGGPLYFGNTWPVLLLVIGVLQLGAALSPKVGHVDSLQLNAAPPPPTVPPANPPQTPYRGQGQ